MADRLIYSQSVDRQLQCSGTPHASIILFIALERGSATFFALRAGWSLALFCRPAHNKITRGLLRSPKNVITQASQKCFKNWKRSSRFCVFEENLMKFLFFGVSDRKNILITEK